MGRLGDRINKVKDIRTEVEREEAYRRQFERATDEYQEYEEYDTVSKRSSESREKRNVQRIAAANRRAQRRFRFVQEVYEHVGMTPTEIENERWVEEVDTQLDALEWGGEDTLLIESSLHSFAERLTDLRKDLSANFLYDEYANQLLTRRHHIPTYAAWCMYTATKAVLNLLMKYPGGAALLEAITPVGTTIPNKQQALDATLNPVYDEHSPEQFLVFIWYEVPGLFDCAQAVLIEYCDAVRAERDRAFRAKESVERGDTPLPDDPEEGGYVTRYGIPEEIRLKRAIEDYTLGAGSYRHVAKEYGIPRDRFLDILHEKGLVRDAHRPAA